MIVSPSKYLDLCENTNLILLLLLRHRPRSNHSLCPNHFQIRCRTENHEQRPPIQRVEENRQEKELDSRLYHATWFVPSGVLVTFCDVHGPPQNV